MLVGGYSLESDILVYGEDLSAVYSHISEILPDIIYKPHPGNYQIDGCLKEMEVFSHPFLPIEAIMKNLRLVISPNSGCLDVLADHKVPVICLIDMLSCPGLNKQVWKQQKLRSPNIQFPQSIVELDRLLLEYF